MSQHSLRSRFSLLGRLTPPARRNRLTWAKATRDLWTEEEVDLYLQDRKRKSCKLDPALNLPSWCSVPADKDPSPPAAPASADGQAN